MTAASFISARQDEQIARAEAKIKRCERKLAAAPAENERRMESIWQNAEKLQRSRERVASAQAATLGVATEKAADTLARALFDDERVQLEWRNQMHQLNGWGYNVREVYDSIIAPAFNAVHYAETKLREAQVELRRAREVKFASQWRVLAGSVIVEASENHLIAELAHGGFRRVEPLDGSGEVSVFRGQLPLLSTDRPFDGLIGIQIIEPDAHQDHRSGEMFPQLRIADQFETGTISPREIGEDDRQPGDFRITECEWEPQPIEWNPTYPIHEIAPTYRGNIVDEGHYVRRVDGELQILHTSGWSHYYDEDDLVRVNILYRDNYPVDHDETVPMRVTELGQRIDVDDRDYHMVRSGAGLLRTMQGENPAKRVREIISSMGYDGEDRDWGFGNGLGGWYYRDEDDDAEGRAHELQRVRSIVMERLGITLDRNWSWH